MLKKRWKAATAMAVVMTFSSAAAHAASFVNGAFESGDFTGWEQGSGTWDDYPTHSTGPGGTLTTDDFFPGGDLYDGGSPPGVFTITSAGTDPNTGGALNMVYSGNHSAKLNDNNNNASVSAIRQTVTNYTDTHIFFAWAAVLEASHDVPDSDNFTLTLRDDTKNLVLYTVSYSSATAPGVFNQFGQNYYTDWQVQNIDLVAAGGDLGDTLTLELFAADCPYYGHWGYVYLDGFGAVLPPPGSVPEPAGLTLLGLGLAGAAALRRRKTRTV